VVESLLRARADRYPAVVVEDGTGVLGFAWTSEYRPRSAYAGVAEFTIYVARDTPEASAAVAGIHPACTRSTSN
jgi:L-amino acid N-acyltransferase YncA